MTETIAARLEADRAERDEQATEVDTLAAAERDVRERTRSPRMRLIITGAAIVVVIIVIIALWLALS